MKCTNLGEFFFFPLDYFDIFLPLFFSLVSELEIG